MDVNSISRSNSVETSRASLALESPSPHMFLGTCALCNKALSTDDELGDNETINLCGDCKFLLLEDIGITSPDVYRRRRPISRRRYYSSESTESGFSQQFSRMISQARLNPSINLENDFQSLDGDSIYRSAQHAISRTTTPNGSRRWQRVFSDTESDEVDSGYWESESNTTFRRFRHFSGGEADTVSYLEDSDDGQSLLEMENFGASDVDSDTDIDPMNAGIYHWNSDDQEEGDDYSDYSYIAQTNSGGFPRSNGSNTYTTQHRDFFRTPEIATQTQHSNRLVTGHEASELLSRVGESGDYLDSRGFQNLLDRLAETEILTRGAPPASSSFVKNLLKVTLTKDRHYKVDNAASCAICKETLTVGTITNQLPCFHMYHPPCILPWLSVRNTCPLCRYELPTDDKDYEERKMRNAIRHETFLTNQGMNNESHQVSEDEDDQGEDSRGENNGQRVSPRNRWFFLAPVASIFGISLMFWLSNSSSSTSSNRRYQSDHGVCYRKETGQRRWWLSFI